MKRKRAVSVGFGLALLIFLAISVVSYLNTEGFIRAQRQEKATLGVLYALEGVISSLKDAETGERGYILTGKWPYLEPYYDGITAVHRDLEELKRAKKSEPNDLKRLERLEGLIEKRFDQIHESITLRKDHGFPAAVQAVATHRRTNLMGNIRDMILGLQLEQGSLLQRQRALSQDKASLTLSAILIGSAVALTVILFSLYHMTREARERGRVEQALRESEQKHRLLVETMNEGFGIVDKDNVFTYVNRRLLDMLGYPEGEVVGSPAYAFLDEGNQGILRSEREKRMNGENTPYEIIWTAADGRKVPSIVSPQPLFDEGGGFQGSYSVVTDITPLKESEEKLRQYQDQLRILSSQLILAEERERRRIATDLHEYIAQNLATAKLKLDQLRGKAASSGLQGPIEETGRHIGDALGDMRILVFDLSPPLLYEMGLPSALEALGEHLMTQRGIRVTFEDDGSPKPLGADICVILYRSVRELLINVARHARAESVHISCRRDQDRVRITVEDDGIGFDGGTSFSDFIMDRKFGLFNIKEHLQTLGGSLNIFSQPGQGARMMVVAPLR
ncbi:MAG: CHASE3 domain-containing protein [Deltaproteobacteria bacterium]|nr:CHASE3 domain-containing protein [Deltaproteobacteria bacterium]